MDKRGQSLTLNTIIIAILVILVLVILVAFFTGGMANLTNKIRTTLFGSIAGTDQTLAVQNCENYCQQLAVLPEAARAKSAFCTKYFNIDIDNNGEADFIPGTDSKDKETKIYKRWYCSKAPPGAERDDRYKDDVPIESLGVSCPDYICP